MAEAEKRIARSAATSDGARRLITYFVGQVVGQLNEVRSTRQVMLDLVEGYVAAASGLAATVAEPDAGDGGGVPGRRLG